MKQLSINYIKSTSMLVLYGQGVYECVYLCFPVCVFLSICECVGKCVACICG